MTRIAVGAVGLVVLLALAGWLLLPDREPTRREQDATFVARLGTAAANPTTHARLATRGALLGRLAGEDGRPAVVLVPRTPTPAD